MKIIHQGASSKPPSNVFKIVFNYEVFDEKIIGPDNEFYRKS